MRLPIRPALFCLASLVAFVSLGLLACGGGSSETGTLQVSLTDAPPCGFDAVKVVVQKVRVHASAGAGANDAGWSEVALNPARTIDLVTLSNGVRDTLGQTLLPAGRYQQMRLVLADAGNSVKPSGSSQEVPLAIPSGQQSGLKMNVDLEVPANKVADFVIDFNACKSVVTRGNGSYALKPVLRGTTVLTDAGQRIDGFVGASVALPTTRVSAQQNGVEIGASTPLAAGTGTADSDIGRFVIAPLPAGSYDLVVTSAGHVTAVMTGVTVTTTAFTTVSSRAVPIAPASSTTRDVGGVLNPPSADVRALQTLTGGPTVEVAAGAPDAVSGAYDFTLPIAAPGKTGYVASPSSISFAADNAVAGHYTLEATDGTTTKSSSIDVNGAVAAQNFSFP